MKKLSILFILFFFQGIALSQEINKDRTIYFKIDNQHSSDYIVDCGVGRYAFTTGAERVNSGKTLIMSKTLVIKDFASALCVPDVVAGSCTFKCQKAACGGPRVADFRISCPKISDAKTAGRKFELDIKITTGPTFTITNPDILQ